MIERKIHVFYLRFVYAYSIFSANKGMFMDSKKSGQNSLE